MMIGEQKKNALCYNAKLGKNIKTSAIVSTLLKTMIKMFHRAIAQDRTNDSVKNKVESIDEMHIVVTLLTLNREAFYLHHQYLNKLSVLNQIFTEDGISMLNQTHIFFQFPIHYLIRNYLLKFSMIFLTLYSSVLV
jgi:hypothetical protein